MAKKRDVTATYTNLGETANKLFRCGHCGRDVGSNKGWTHGQNHLNTTEVFIQICPMCGRPNVFEDAQQWPGPKSGGGLQHLPPEVDSLYEEARTVLAAGAPTSSTLALRKLLMHVAVQKGAAAGGSFQDYVNYFEAKNLVPAGAKDWIDHIRKKGNEANHEIVVMSLEDADELLVFSEMLLKLIYEFPNRLPMKKGSP